MTTPKQLESAVAKVINQHHLDGWFTPRELAFAILKEVEPLIRADERERVNVSWQNDFDNEMTDLRAKVAALIPPGEGLRAWDAGRREAIRDVLALFDGDSE